MLPTMKAPEALERFGQSYDCALSGTKDGDREEGDEKESAQTGCKASFEIYLKLAIRNSVQGTG